MANGCDMIFPSNASCPRCNSSFECNTENITQCQCYSVVVSEATQKYLQKTSYDCLCADCLKEINKMTEYIKNHPLPDKGDLIEGIHYHVNDGLVVFSELYLMQRGYCCKNGCRNCAYGYKKGDRTSSSR